MRLLVFSNTFLQQLECGGHKSFKVFCRNIEINVTWKRKFCVLFLFIFSTAMHKKCSLSTLTSWTCPPVSYLLFPSMMLFLLSRYVHNIPELKAKLHLAASYALPWLNEFSMTRKNNTLIFLNTSHVWSIYMV